MITKLLISKLDFESKQQIEMTDDVTDQEPREVKNQKRQ